MRFVFRGDASSINGSGHVMRLSAIAEEAIARGYETIFVGQINDLGWVKSFVTKVGFDSLFETGIDFRSNFESDVLILDSYQIPIDNQFIQPEKWLKVVTLADSQTPNYKSNLKIHPGLNDDWCLGPKDNFIYGQRYIPLRKSITKHDYHNYSYDEDVLNVVVTGGGSDPFNFCKSLAEEISKISGDFNVNFISNDLTIANLDSRFSVTLIGAIMEDDFKYVGLAFTTASTSSLEFIAREIPTGIGCAVENQQIYYESIQKSGVSACIGTRIVTGDWIFESSVINDLITSNSVRAKLRKMCFEFIDLNGASRIIDEIVRESNSNITY